MSMSHGTRMSFDIDQGGAKTSLEANCASISLGQFLCQTLTVKVPESLAALTLAIPAAPDWDVRTVQVWPVTGDVQWPPSEDVDQERYDAMNQRFSVGARKV